MRLGKYQRRIVKKIEADLLRNGAFDIVSPEHRKFIQGRIYGGRKGRSRVRKWNVLMKQVAILARKEKK